MAALGAALGLFGLLGLFAGAGQAMVYSHLVLGALLLGYAALRSAGRLSELVRATSGRVGSHVVVQTLVICIIAGLLGFLSVRNPRSWDWTESQLHTLTEATLSVLERIPEQTHIEVLGFYSRGSEAPAERLLEMYADRSERLEFAFHDPNERPELAQRYEIRSAQGVLLVCAGPCESARGTVRVSDPTEDEVTKAIRSVISDQRKLYVLAGHGEAGLQDEQAQGLSVIREALENENYQVEELVLSGHPQVPEDGDGVLLVGPNHSVLPQELELLDRYLRGGGGLAVLVDPLVVSGLEERVRSWGVVLGDDVIVEQQQTLFSGPQLAVQPIVSTYGTHPITEKLGSELTLYNMARSLGAAEDAPSPPTELALTSPASWAETDTDRFVQSSEVGRDPETDRVGPVPVAMAVSFESEGNAAAGRLVVVGDSDFIRNRYVAQGYNADLFLNMVNWLVGEEAFATIERKVPRASTASMTWEQFASFRFASLFLLPEAILLLSLFGWWRRRH